MGKKIFQCFDGTCNDRDPIRITRYLNRDRKAAETGEPMVFPDHLPSKYGNSLDSIRVTVKRVA